ncbi:hypothetical protein [Brevibacterium renqingii]|uniref:hypothetical protein n=1 Tax=Brevibacterium renqingii TaxID=2776916 RepID=UPI0020A48F5C|nr:hypothetical protein [Brevibacterium renqingii]
MSQSDDELVVVLEVIQRGLDILGERDDVHRTVASGNEDRRVVIQPVRDHIGKPPRILERCFGALPSRGHGFIVVRMGPPFELARPAGERGHVDAVAGLKHVVEGQQGLHGLVAGREVLAVLHQHVPLFGGESEDLPPRAGVLLVCGQTVEIGRGGGVLGG